MCTYLRSLNEKVDNVELRGGDKSLDNVLLDLQESNKSLCALKKLQLQDKTLVISELKHQLAQVHEKSPVTQCESPNFDSRIQKIEDENVLLAFQELLEEARALKSLDEHIGHAFKFAERIQELLVSTDASGSKLRRNTKNDRIHRPSHRSKKNNVEAQTRTSNSSLNKNNHVSDCNANVKNVAVSKNSANVCLSCNEFLFSANHDACAVKYLKDVQIRRMFNMEVKIIQTSPVTIVPPGNRPHTIRIPAVAPSAKTRIRYSITKNSLIRAHINSYGHPFNLPNFDFIVEIVLWYLDLRCSKHMIGRDKLINFDYKFIGTVRFDNDHFAAIMGYGDLQIGNILISRVYYVKGLGHNLFFVGPFSDSDLKVEFRKHTCFVHNLEGVDLLSGSRCSNLYTISMADMMKSYLIFLLSKASKIKSWLWHRHLSHLNFDTINQLAKQGPVKGLPKLKYIKDHLCLACQMGKSKKESRPHKLEPSTNEKLQMMHMDLCGPMRVGSINGKRYIIVIVNDYSRFTCVNFLRTKDEALEIIIKILKQAQVSLKATVRYLCTDNGPELQGLTSRHISSGLVLNQSASTSAKPPTKNDWDILFQPMFDEYFKPLSVVSTPFSLQLYFHQIQSEHPLLLLPLIKMLPI
ncbi:retrovirus-related pol polyprotein from transposon TNT 1-94 [Tanacetum coccineum]